MGVECRGQPQRSGAWLKDDNGDWRGIRLQLAWTVHIAALPWSKHRQRYQCLPLQTPLPRKSSLCCGAASRSRFLTFGSNWTKEHGGHGPTSSEQNAKKHKAGSMGPSEQSRTFGRVRIIRCSGTT